MNNLNMIEVARLYNGNSNQFMQDRVRFLRRNGVLIDNDDKIQIEMLYKRIVFEVVKYLRTFFPKGFVNTEGTYNLDLDDMLAHLSIEARWFLSKPVVSTTVKPFYNDESARISFSENYATRVRNVHRVKGMPLKYRKENFDKSLEGKSIFEIRDILNGLKVLPFGSDLDTLIMELKEKQAVHQKYLESIIAKLVLSGDEEDLVRAHLFDSFAGVNFDFSAFELEPESYRMTI